MIIFFCNLVEEAIKFEFLLVLEPGSFIQFLDGLDLSCQNIFVLPSLRSFRIRTLLVVI